jgi:hypothetical protein
MFVPAVSTGAAIAYCVAVFGLLLVLPGTITLLKGQRLLFLAGLLFAGIVWWITALRLGRPDSWWARRYYRTEKLARAQRRYG